MKVIGAEVDWMEGWGNSPRLVVTVDLLPPQESLRFRRIGSDYIAVCDGYMSKIWKADPRVPDNGFGGRVQQLTMEDGLVVEFCGGWASATCFSWNHPEWGKALVPFTECDWIERDGRCPGLHYSGWITLDLFRDVIANFLPDIEIYQGDHNFYPKRICEEPKNPRKRESVLIATFPLSAEQIHTDR